MKIPPASARRAAQFYPVARTAHVERLPLDGSVDFFYQRTRADWHSPQPPRGSSMKKVSTLEMARIARSGRYSVIEIPELLAVRLLPAVLFVALGSRLSVRRRRTTLVYYAIENLSQVDKVSNSLPVPRRLVEVLLRISWFVCGGAVTKVCFGTSAAQAMYETEFGPLLWRHFAKKTEVCLIPAVPAEMPYELARRRDPVVTFLGTFEGRKGIHEVMAAWPHVLGVNPAARLNLIGFGPELEKVTKFAVDFSRSVSLHIDPERKKIADLLSQTRVLVLLSRRTNTWREQVGLPIVEALAHGCAVVTTSETGLATWLEGQGHSVLEEDCSSEEVGLHIAHQLRTHSVDRVLESLPASDGRLSAEKWLLGGLRVPN